MSDQHGPSDQRGPSDREHGDDERLFHVDGELVPESAATVSVRDRGFRYGDGAFETMRAYGGEIFRWDAHADRLAGTCETLELTHDLPRAALADRVHETLEANDLADAYVRLSITRGVQPGKLTPDPDIDPTIVVEVKSLPRGGRGSTPIWDGPAAIQTVKTRRMPDRAVPSAAKTHNYLNGILARLELRTSDADEAMMLNVDGHVAEGATSNLFFVSEHALRTPSLDADVLPGITRRVVLDIARAEGIPVEEGTYTPDDVRGADEVFLTNSTWEIRPVSTVDGIDIGEADAADGENGEDPYRRAGPLTTLLARLYDARVERECIGGE